MFVQCCSRSSLDMILTKVHPSLQFLFVSPLTLSLFYFIFFLSTILHKMKYICTPFVWQCKNESGVVYKFIAYNILFVSTWNMDPIYLTKLSLNLAGNRGFIFCYLKQINMDALNFFCRSFCFGSPCGERHQRCLGGL